IGNRVGRTVVIECSHRFDVEFNRSFCSTGLGVGISSGRILVRASRENHCSSCIAQFPADFIPETGVRNGNGPFTTFTGSSSVFTSSCNFKDTIPRTVGQSSPGNATVGAPESLVWSIYYSCAFPVRVSGVTDGYCYEIICTVSTSLEFLSCRQIH